MIVALNILWLLLGGGLLAGVVWFLVGVIAALTIVGLPWARACFTLGQFSFLPFGKEVISRKELSGHDDIGTGPLGTIGNIVWFLLVGWWLALWHLALALFLVFTIIGIPFAIAHLKLAGASLFPIGKTVQPKELVAMAKQENAAARLEEIRDR